MHGGRGIDDGLHADSTGARLRRARIARGLSLNEFAEAVGVTKVTAWGWENNKFRPRTSKLRIIIDTLGTRPDDLFPEEFTSLHGVGGLVADCKKRIADAVGLKPQDIAIIVSFGNSNDPHHDEAVVATRRRAR